MINAFTFTEGANRQLMDYANKPDDFQNHKYNTMIEIHGQPVFYTWTFNRDHITRVAETDHVTARLLNFLTHHAREEIVEGIMYQANAFINDVRRIKARQS